MRAFFGGGVGAHQSTGVNHEIPGKLQGQPFQKKKIHNEEKRARASFFARESGSGASRARAGVIGALRWLYGAIWGCRTAMPFQRSYAAPLRNAWAAAALCLCRYGRFLRRLLQGAAGFLASFRHRRFLRHFFQVQEVFLPTFECVFLFFNRI